MAKPSLKIIETERDTSRSALAAAIAELRHAETDIELAHEAREKARDRWFAAEDALGALRKEGSKQSYADAFISSIRSGGDCDAATLDRAAIDATAQERELEHAVRIWKKANDDCKLEIANCETRLSRAQRIVEEAARSVIGDVDVVTRIREGLDDMHAEVMRRRIVLRFILTNGRLPDEIRKELNLFLNANTCLPGGYESWFSFEWDKHSEALAWTNAFETLKNDADAPLPVMMMARARKHLALADLWAAKVGRRNGLGTFLRSRPAAVTAGRINSGIPRVCVAVGKRPAGGGAKHRRERTHLPAGRRDRSASRAFPGRRGSIKQNGLN